ncbi:hypothetical protein BH11PAT1_BH11PAT1_6530 [soil metagenome]
MITLLLFLVAAWIGYLGFRFFNDPIKHPQSNKNRLPRVRYKNIEIFPYTRIHIRAKTFHIHHWLTLTIITSITFFAYEHIQHLIVFKGIAVGGIIQGLRYPDRFKFKHPRYQ